jgi:hypothetical protein
LLISKVHSKDKITITFCYNFEELHGKFKLIKWNPSDVILQLIDFEIEKQHRRKGKGKQLFERVIEEVLFLKCDKLYIVYEDIDAKNFWETITKKKFKNGLLVI